MKKQTAIDWLIEQLIAKEPNNIALKLYFESNGILISSAKRIEKQQIIDTYFAGYNYEGGRTEEQAEQYYNETYNK
jgi:hypothetical protein